MLFYQKMMKHVNATRRTKLKKASEVRASSRPNTGGKGPRPKTGGKDPRRNHCCRAYRKALRKAKTAGKPEALRRLDAQAAYKKAGREFDCMRS